MRDTYLELLDELRELTLKKRAGYSPGDDPYSNFRMSSMFGVDPLKGILVRVMDKMARVSSLLENPANDLIGESLRDNLIDAGNYLLIAAAFRDSELDRKWRDQESTLEQEEARRWLSGDDTTAPEDEQGPPVGDWFVSGPDAPEHASSRHSQWFIEEFLPECCDDGCTCREEVMGKCDYCIGICPCNED